MLKYINKLVKVTINMKIIKESKIEERFNKPSDRAQHYVDHVVPSGFSNRKNPWGKNDYEFTPYEYADEFEYESAAEEFVLNTVPHGSIMKNPADPVGFMDSDDRVHLYDPSTGQFTVYKVENGEVITISYHLFSSNNRYERDKSKYYKREIPKNYNKQIKITGTHAE